MQALLGYTPGSRTRLHLMEAARLVKKMLGYTNNKTFRRISPFTI
jgi:hypothetical protein